MHKNHELVLTELEALTKAVKLAGGQTELATAMNAFLPPERHVRQRNVWSWLNRSKRISPPDMAIACEKACGVSRHILRPDVYPKEARQAA